MTSLTTPCTRVAAQAALGEHQLRRLLTSGALRQPWPGVLLSRETTLDPVARAGAALLLAGPEACITGLSTALLAGCVSAATPDVHLHVPYSRWLRTRAGLRVHHRRRALNETVTVQGVRSVPLAEAVVEVLCSMPPRRGLAVADEATALADQARAEFVAELDHAIAVRPDRRGTRRASALLPLITGGAQSPRESALKLLVVAGGLPLPVEQHPILDLDGRLRYVLDLAWPQWRVAMEYDGHEAHVHRADADAARDEDLRLRGWTVVRARAADLAAPELLLHDVTTAIVRHGGVVGEPVADLQWPPQRGRACVDRTRRGV